MGTPFVNTSNPWSRPDKKYAHVIDKIGKDGVCPFCPEHLARYHKNPILKEGEYWLMTDNMYPYDNAAHHILFIHKTHIGDFHELTDSAWSELRNIVGAVIKERKIPGGAFLFRFGDTAYTGATVTHLHANLVSGSGAEGSEPILARLG